MEVEKAKELFELLKGLPMEDYAEEEFNEEDLRGDYNIIDFWKSKGKKLTIVSDFTDSVDLSYSEIDEVVLVGRFNRVDATKAKIKILDTREAAIVKLDLAEAEVEEVKGGR